MNAAAAVFAPLVLLACGATVEIPQPSLDGMEPQVAEKIETTRALVVRDLRSGAAWGKLGLVFESHGLREEARGCYRQAAELSPDDYRWLYYQAALEQHSDPVAALELASRAESLSPRSAPVLLLKASLQEQLDDIYAARTTYRQILEQKRNMAVAEFALGRIELGARELQKALAHLERAAELQPQAGAIQAALARLYRLRGDREAAVAAAESARELEPEVIFRDPLAQAIRNEEVSTRALQRRAQEAEAAGAIRVAEQLHTRLLELHPEEAELHYNLGNFFARSGRLEEAARSFRRALEIDKDHAEATVNLGNLLASKGELAEAERLLRRAVRLEPEASAALVGLSSALAEQGELEEAVRLLEQVLAKEPENLSALKGLAQIRAAEGSIGLALQLLERALSAHPDDAQTHFLTALNAARQGKFEKAWRHVHEAQRLRFAVPDDFVVALRESMPEREP